MKQIQHWLDAHYISEVEALMPDLSGVARGKVMPTAMSLLAPNVNSYRRITRDRGAQFAARMQSVTRITG